MLDYSFRGSALVQGNMSPVCMIVGNVCAPKPPKMTFVQRNNMVEQLSTHAADPAFRRSILPRAPNAGAQRLEITGSQELDNFISELGIMVEQHVSIGAGKRECFLQLLHDPIACWTERHVELQNPPAITSNREEAIQGSAPKCRYSKD